MTEEEAWAWTMLEMVNAGGWALVRVPTWKLKQ